MEISEKQIRYDRDSFEILVYTYENKLYRTALTLMGNRADAEDMVQDAFIKLYEKQPEFESTEHEKAWLIRVTINLCKNRLRSSWWKKTESLLDSYPWVDTQQDELINTVMELPTKYRIVILLYYYEGYSSKEIAEIIGKNDAAVRQLLSRARKELKNYLEGELW